MMTLRNDELPALIVGGDSLVGGEIRRQLNEAKRPFAFTSRKGTDGAIPLDLAVPDMHALETVDTDTVFFCAAVTNMAACEADPAGTWRINVDHTLDLIRYWSERHAHVVFFSSSQVFDGDTPAPDETAEICPKNEYGRQKTAVENEIAEAGLPAAIVRPTKILADHPVGMFAQWWQLLNGNEKAYAASNLSFAPIPVRDVADLSIRLAARRRDGLWHIASRNSIAYDAAARLMARMAGLPVSLVESEVLTEEKVPAIFRHRFTDLATDKVVQELNFPIKSAEEILQSLFAHLRTSGRTAP